jgi:hypothetical protein
VSLITLLIGASEMLRATEWERLPDGTLQVIHEPLGAHRRSVKDRLEALTKGQIDGLDT